MKLIEVHVLQSYPFNNQNADDLGECKSGIFGGVNRARVSKQCAARAVREYCRELFPALFCGERTRYLWGPLTAALKKAGVPDNGMADLIAESKGTWLELDPDAKGKGDAAGAAPIQRLQTAVFFSPMEIDAMASEIAAAYLKHPTKKELKGVIRKATRQAIKATALRDGADIALFGRMVADDQTISVQGAVMMNHPVSTHTVTNQLDYFSLVEDRQPEGATGSAHNSYRSFTASTMYRWGGINVDLLAETLPLHNPDIAAAFVEGMLMSMPKAKLNASNASTLPGYALVVLRNTGHPLQLVNAFENPVKEDGGMMAPSILALKAHWAQLKTEWNIKPVAELEKPGSDLKSILDAVRNHVKVK